MKVRIIRLELKKALTNVCKVVPARSAKPILQNVKLSRKDGDLILSGTDLDRSLTIKVQCEDLDPHPKECVVKAHLLKQIVTGMTSHYVDLHVEKQEGSAVEMLIITGDTAEFNIPCDDVAEFPSFPEFNGKDRIAFPSALLLDMVKRVVFAAAREQARYAFNGVLLDAKKNGINMVATDGKRLSCVKLKLPNKSGVEGQFIILSLSLKILKDVYNKTDKIYFDVIDGHHIFSNEYFTLYSRAIEGNFPSYEEVVPKNNVFAGVATLDCKSFKSTLKLASAGMDMDSKAAALLFNEEKLIVRFGNFNAESIIETEGSYKGEPRWVAVNPIYVADLLTSRKGDVTLRINDDGTPVKLSLPFDYGTHEYIVMPVKIELGHYPDYEPKPEPVEEEVESATGTE